MHWRCIMSVNSVLSMISTFRFPCFCLSSRFYQKQYVLNVLYLSWMFFLLHSEIFTTVLILFLYFKRCLHARHYICFLQCLLMILKIPICIVRAKLLKYIFPCATAAPPSVYSRGCPVLHCAWLSFTLVLL